MSPERPRVSIGLPVYNGENYIREALDSVLAQTFKDFEVTISDNASTDSTEQICREYAALDDRIRYHRSDTNQGPSWNFNRVFTLSRGEYFKWLSHDDTCHPTMIEKCVRALDGNQSAVLCCAKLSIVEHDGSKITPYRVERHLDDPSPNRRYYRILKAGDWALEIHGVMRASTLQKTPLIQAYPSSDHTLLARMALMGPFIEIPEYLSFYRIHPRQSTSRDRFSTLEFWRPGANGRISFPQWNLGWEFLRCINDAPLPVGERLLCYYHLFCWPAWEANWRRLGKDVLVAAATLLRGRTRRSLSSKNGVSIA